MTFGMRQAISACTLLKELEICDPFILASVWRLVLVNSVSLGQGNIIDGVPSQCSRWAQSPQGGHLTWRVHGADI